jgi:outer membrane protein OmpA-like peptidoglycan-associated protein
VRAGAVALTFLGASSCAEPPPRAEATTAAASSSQSERKQTPPSEATGQGDAAPAIASAEPAQEPIEIKTTVPYPSLVATPPPSVAPALDEVAAVIKRHPTIVVEIGGHADGQEDESVAFARANLVRSSLVARGVGADRLVVKTYGKTRPVAASTSEAGRAKNRRVEFRVVGQ